MTPNNQPTPQVETVDLAQRREFARRSMLRANRSIGAILAVVALLGGVLALVGQRARESQRRAEQAEHEATERLWTASLARARAENRSTRMGRREAALDAARMAAKLRPSMELRNEAITALSQRDFVVERDWKAKPNPYGFNFDPDLKYYVTRYDPQLLSLYRMDDNTHVRDFSMPLMPLLVNGANVGDFQFSATGKYIAIRYNGGLYTIVETETARIVRLLGFGPLIRRWSWPPSFTADDRFLCMNMSGADGERVLYDIDSGEPVKLPQWPVELKWSGGNSQVTVSPQGDRLAWYQGAEISLLDATTGALLKSIKAPSQVQAFRWDEQGKRVSFQAENYALSVWEVESGRVTQMGGTAVFAWQQRFSPDGRLLLTSGQDGATRLWDVATARLICQTNSARGLEFNRAGDRVAWGVPGERTGVWRITRPEANRSFTGCMMDRSTVWQQDITNDGRLAVWSPPTRSGLTGMDLLDLEAGGVWHLPMPRKAMAGFHPVKHQLWLAGGGEGVRLMNLPERGLPKNADWMANPERLPLPKGFQANGASFSSDGFHVAVSGGNSALLAMDLRTPDKPVMLEPGYRSHESIPGPGSSSGCGAMCLSPEGRWVAAGRYTPGAQPNVWDALTGKIVGRLDGVFNSHVGFSPDGKLLFAAGQNASGLWSTGDWKRRWLIPRPPMIEVSSMGAFSTDGTLIAWNRGMLAVELLTISGETVAALDVEELGCVAGIRFAGDGKKLFVTGMEGRMLTIDIPVLRGQLAGMGLDWTLPTPLPTPPSAAVPPAPGALWSSVLLSLIPVGAVAALGVLVLLRQRRLTGEFMETAELAACRTQELAAEKEVGELKSRFVTTVSHEFRTPLGITMSAVELLRHYQDRLPDEEKARLCDDIHSATSRMADLMEQVLLLGRVDAGKLACKPMPLDIEALARKLTDESLSATSRKCPIEWTAENDISGAHADEALLRHIFINLLSNGVKYSPPGAPVIFRARREGPMAVFTIRDSGIGIPEKDLPDLFEAFHRGGNVGDIPGTGLGLVLSKRCAEIHGGSIQVKSVLGEGCTFTTRIPAWV